MDNNTTDKILLIYYSRTGFTKKIAELLAAEGESHVEAIKDVKSRRGLFGYMRSAFEALKKSCLILNPCRRPFAIQISSNRIARVGK